MGMHACVLPLHFSLLSRIRYRIHDEEMRAKYVAEELLT